MEKIVSTIRTVRPPFRVGNKFLDSRKGNIVITTDADEDEDFAMGKLPVQQERLFEMKVGMLCQEEWQPRTLVLGSEYLMICLVGSEDILDKVPLVLPLLFIIIMIVLTCRYSTARNRKDCQHSSCG